MIFPSTHTDLESLRDRARETAVRAAAAYGATAIVFAESGTSESSGYSFSRRGGAAGRWASRWQGVRSEAEGAGDRRFAWREGLHDAAWEDISALNEPAAGRDRTLPFPGHPVAGDPTDDEFLVRRLVDAASAAARFSLVEAEVRRLERSVLVCRSDASPVLRRERSVRWRLRILPREHGPFHEWTEIDPPRVPEAWAIAAVESVLDTGNQATSPMRPGLVWLEPAAAAVWLHEVIGHTLEADYGDRSASSGAGDVGLAIWNVPLRAGATDDEGIPERRIRLAGPGEACIRLTDALHAARDGSPRTGNGRRQDFRFAVLPRIGALRAERVAGPDIPDRIGSGPVLRVASILAGHVNPSSNRFVLDIGRAEYVDGDRRAAPPAGLRLAGYVSSTLDGLLAMGRETAADDPARWPRRLCVKGGQVVETANFCPSLLLSGLETAG